MCLQMLQDFVYTVFLTVDFIEPLNPYVFCMVKYYLLKNFKCVSESYTNMTQMLRFYETLEVLFD